MKRSRNKPVPAAILAEAAKPAFQRISAAKTNASPVYENLLEDMEKCLLDPEVKMIHLWAGRRLEHSGHSGQLGALLGAPPCAFISQLRMSVAARLLADERIADIGVEQIAYESGFKSCNALTAAFKDRFGMTASDFREASQNGELGELMILGSEFEGTAPDPTETEDSLVRFRKSLNRTVGLTARGEIELAFTELSEAAAWIADQGDARELAAEVHACRGFVHHRRAEFLVRELDLDNACLDLEEARAAYSAAGELPPIIRGIRRDVGTSWDIRATLAKALCGPCASELQREGGRTLREHLAGALEPVPLDLEWFQVCCDPCYRVVWEAIGQARLGLMDDAWKAFWLVAHADPVEDVPPSLARYVRALHESEILTHQAQRPRLELCRLAVETARELGDPLREAYALCFVANALRAMGRFDEARATLQAARERCQENLWTAAFLARAGGHLAAQERIKQEALAGLATARSLYNQLDPHLAGRIIVHEGELLFHEKEYESAGRALEEAFLALDRRREPELANGALPINLAATLVAAGRAEDAKIVLSRCEFDRFTYRGMAATENLLAGCLGLADGLLEEALRFFQKATDLFESLNRPRDKAFAISYSVEAYARLGKREKAIECAAEALGFFRALGCKQDTIDGFAMLRQQLEAAVIDTATVAVTVRRLAQNQGGWLPEPKAGGAESMINRLG